MSASDKRFQAALAIMQGLAAGLQWQAGKIIHEDEMAADAVALADAVLAELEKQTP